MSTGLLSSFLNAQPDAPAGQMQVDMLPIGFIMRNPENKIYVIGDIQRLKDDIRENGVRQPLEVIRWANGYKLIGGERRLTACKQLLEEGDERFSSLPCVIVESKGELEDKISLITSNATARDLTDGERVAQYEALKDALTQKKKEGKLDGKVRDELCRILGLSAGAAARLNVIATCENEHIKHQLNVGEISLMQAYHAAQDYARYTGKASEPEEPEKAPAEPQKAATPETLPKPTTETVTRPITKLNIPANDLEILERAAKSVSPYAQPVPPAAKPAADAEEPRGHSTLQKLAEKMLREDAPWTMAWEDVQFRLSYYNQPLPGGATLWKRTDNTRKWAEQICDDYAIILQDGKFFTCGWIGHHSGITDILTKYFELK